MKRQISTIILFTIMIGVGVGQSLTQTLRGTLVDADSKTPLIGASIIIQETEPLMGTTTDLNGSFRFENIPVGRINLQISYIGYESQTVSNIVLNSGKETVMEISLQESVLNIDEVQVKANRKKGEALNEMSLLSSRSISTEESSRYTGGMNDPSRVVSSFAGVAATPDGSSDIIVRGNSPKYMQWRLDGIEITSPYHFDEQNASYGALTALNNDLLSTSDFYTGAFNPEYGNVLSSVFDVKLRSGNNEKFEATAGIGIMGTDLTFEGPFKKGYTGSYLVNYRYSTVSLIQDIGLIDVDGVLSFQDATFKFMLPTKKAGTFSVFGLGGLNGFDIKDQLAGNVTIPGEVQTGVFSQDYDKSAFLGNVGINHILPFNANSYLKTSLSFSSNGFADDVYNSKINFIFDDQDKNDEYTLSDRKQVLKSDVKNQYYRGTLQYNNKINANHRLQIGIKYTLTHYDFNQNMYDYTNESLRNVTDFTKSMGTVNNYISWKYRINENITLVSGLHNVNVLLNNKSTLEPRIAFNWKINYTTTFSAGYGKHSTMEKIQNYYAKVSQPDGNTTEPNKNLDLLKANHYVAGIEKRFTPNLMVKIEAYYQYLYDLPVENNDTSIYATINEGYFYKYVDLVNEGTGRNYGVELTIERFFDKSYYYMVNASLFNSMYTALDGIERNTQYNGNYMMNILCGKEYTNMGRKKNKTLALNAKLFYGGGKKYIPLLRDVQGNVAINEEKNQYWDYSKAYKNALDDIFNLNFSVSYKINKKKSTHELFLDLMNLTNNQARLWEFYDETAHDKVGYVKQIFFFPNFMYRVYF